MQIGIAVHTGAVYICNVIGGITASRCRDASDQTEFGMAPFEVAGANEALVSSRAGAAARLDISDQRTANS